MTSRLVSRHGQPIGVTRRELLQVGYCGLLGMGLPGLLAKRAAAATNRSATPGGKAKSVILVFLTGAPSHIDTFDMKPDAPVEVRGSFRPIATTVPGIQICEHLPQLAARADHFAIVRSMTHGVPEHEHATQMLLTGIDSPPPGSTFMATRFDWPCYASALDFVRPRDDGVPNGVVLPTYLTFRGYGFPGQNAGWLGPKHDPWHVVEDPNDPKFKVDLAALPVGMSTERVRKRQALLADVERQQVGLAAMAESRHFTDLQHRAFSLLSSGRVAEAFAVGRETEETRDRYGRHSFGQSLLLARRLVEAGVPMVQANMGRMNNWDTHNDNCKQLKERLLPPLDQAMAALLDDLTSRNMLDETLIVMVGEFSRTPKLGGNLGTADFNPDGRDHWAGVFFAVVAGAGVRGGQVIGKSDKIAAFPASREYYPSDLGATIYSALGVDLAAEARDRLGRPNRLNHGEVIAPLFTG